MPDTTLIGIRSAIRDTSTYGETFTAPSNGDHFLNTFSLYMGGPYASGDIVLGAYIATWDGSKAGTLLWSSGPIDYQNTGEAQLSFNTGGLDLTGGGSYIAFISISEFYGQSSGQSYIDGGNGGCPGCAFAYFNNQWELRRIVHQQLGCFRPAA